METVPELAHREATAVRHHRHHPDHGQALTRPSHCKQRRAVVRLQDSLTAAAVADAGRLRGTPGKPTIRHPCPEPLVAFFRKECSPDYSWTWKAVGPPAVLRFSPTSPTEGVG